MTTVLDKLAEAACAAATFNPNAQATSRPRRYQDMYVDADGSDTNRNLLAGKI